MDIIGKKGNKCKITKPKSVKIKTKGKSIIIFQEDILWIKTNFIEKFEIEGGKEVDICKIKKLKIN